MLKSTLQINVISYVVSHNLCAPDLLQNIMELYTQCKNSHIFTQCRFGHPPYTIILIIFNFLGLPQECHWNNKIRKPICSSRTCYSSISARLREYFRTNSPRNRTHSRCKTNEISYHAKNGDPRRRGFRAKVRGPKFRFSRTSYLMSQYKFWFIYVNNNNKKSKMSQRWA